ncbi:hypothetical protein JHK85_027268 [Glycine max]|nr:hypothetical protein JHK85_027268 [Glycine max]
MYEIRSTSYNCSGLKKMLKNLNPLDQRALDYCLKLFEDTSVELKATIDDLSIKSTIGSKRHHDLQTLLSGAMTNLYTYLDGFAYSKGRVGDRIEKKLLQISHHVSNSLAMLNKVPGVEKLTTSSDSDETKFNLVVAKDGTGNFTTIGEALSVAPNSSTTRFVIHVTAGAYFENVEVIRKKTNLMFVGDGIGKTVVKGSRNVEDGWTIFQSATVDPAGWLEWNETFALDTLYYGEYMNRGPCSNTSGRVTWPGYRVINSSIEASQFTVGQFIQDNDWLNNTGIPFFSGLS